MLSGGFWDKHTSMHQNSEQEVARTAEYRTRLFLCYYAGWTDAETKRLPGPRYLSRDDERKRYLEGFDARKESDGSR